MSKKYLEVFTDSAETQYASGVTPVLSVAALNTGVSFSPVMQSNGDATVKNSIYAIQRMKRIKAVDSPMNSIATAESSQGSKFGDDLVAGLNALTKVEWDTVETTTGKEEIIGVTVEPNEEYSILEDASAYERPIANKVKNTLIAMEEAAIAKLVAVKTPAALKITTAQDAANGIMDEVFKIEELVDDFKAYSDGIVVFIHPRIAKLMGELEGQGYSLGTNTFPTGKGKSFTYQGIEFFQTPVLNAIAGSAAGKVPAAIVMDKEAYANAGLTESMTPFDDKYMGTRVVGHRYYFLDAVVDPARISVLEFDNTASKKVNA